jgi:hypothetical protein
MLGESAVSQACAANDFAVCKFRDRFPTDSDTFLWSEDKRTGVFNVADMQTRRALSKEQMRFALAVIPPNLGRVVCSVFQDGLRQLTTIGLGEYRYDATRLDFFKNRLPSRDFARMASSVAARSRIYVIFGRRLSYSTAALGLAVIVLLLSGALRPAGVTRETKTTRENVWRAATYLPLAGIVLNAFICGGLSSVNDRYEARVIWLIQLSLITGIYVLRPQVKLVSLFKSKLGRKIAVVQG